MRPPPTPTPAVYNISVTDRSYYFGHDNPDGYLRPGVEQAQSEFFDNLNITLNMPQVQNQTESIELLDMNDSSTLRILSQIFGKKWDEDGCAWLLVGRIINSNSYGGFFYTFKAAPTGTINGYKLTVIEQGHTASQLAKIIEHELGHEAGLYHTNDINNVMYPQFNFNHDVSEDIQEINDGSQGFYYPPRSDHRNQKDSYQNIWIFNNIFDPWQ